MHSPCPRCAAATLTESTDASGAQVLGCTSCHGVLCIGAHVERWLGGSLSQRIALMDPFARPAESTALVCPFHPHGKLELTPLTDVPSGVYRCRDCQAVFVEHGLLPRVRAGFPAHAHARGGGQPSRRPPQPVQPMSAPVRVPLPDHAEMRTMLARDEGHLVGARVDFDNPWINLITLPLALLLALVGVSNAVLRLFIAPLQIQFHELGHAIPAWLSSRAALPLPFGFTFWREERSLFTGLCVSFLLGLLVYRGLRERRAFGVALGGVLLLVQALFSLGISLDRSRMLVIMGGVAGELINPCLVLVAFFFPLPDRLRWDFFRFVLLFPATAAWLASARLWLRISRGQEAMPMGSLLGTPGDGSGDLERLVSGYHFTQSELAHTYLSIVMLTAAVIGVVYLRFAGRALAALRSGRDDS